MSAGNVRELRPGRHQLFSGGSVLQAWFLLLYKLFPVYQSKDAPVNSFGAAGLRCFHGAHLVLLEIFSGRICLSEKIRPKSLFGTNFSG